MFPPAMAAPRPSGTARKLVFLALVASAASQIWQTQDCLAAIEIESTAPTGSWQLSSAHGGFTGTGYVPRASRPRRAPHSMLVSILSLGNPDLCIASDPIRVRRRPSQDAVPGHDMPVGSLAPIIVHSHRRPMRTARVQSFSEAQTQRVRDSVPFDFDRAPSVGLGLGTSV